MIRKIHQTSRTNELSAHQLESKELLQKYNPELAYRLWEDKDLEELARKHFPEVHAVWHELLGIQKADLGRYMILYQEGGFYADTDIYTRKNLLKELSMDSSVVFFAPSTPIWPWSKHTMTNYFLFAPFRKSPFLLSLIQASVSKIRAWSGTKDQSYVPKTTGREIVSSTAKAVDGVKSFDPKEVTDLFCSSTKVPDSCVVYHAGSTTRSGTTWHKDYTMLIVKLECFLRTRLGFKGNLSQAPAVIISIVMLVLFWLTYLLI